MHRTDLLIFVSLGGCSGHALTQAIDLGELGDVVVGGVVVGGGIDGWVKLVGLQNPQMFLLGFKVQTQQMNVYLLLKKTNERLKNKRTSTLFILALSFLAVKRKGRSWFWLEKIRMDVVKFGGIMRIDDIAWKFVFLWNRLELKF
jgi:hypothetical protein